MGSFVYVGNLSSSATEDSVRDAFAATGNQVKQVVIMRSPQRNRPRGFGFVEFGSETEIDPAIQSMNGVELHGQKLTVSHVRPDRSRIDTRNFQSYGTGQRTGGPRRGGARRKTR